MQPLKFPERRTLLDDTDSLAYGPAGGRGTQIFAGVFIALIPIIYGIYCIDRGWTPLFGSNSPSLIMRGFEGQVLAAGYMALGAFCHFHWYWGLHPRLCRYSQALKKVSLVAFLLPLLWVIWQVVRWTLPIE